MRHPLICYFALAYGISWLVWAPLWLPARCFTSDASSPIVINIAGALITLWGIAVVLMVGPRRVASQRERS